MTDNHPSHLPTKWKILAASGPILAAALMAIGVYLIGVVHDQSKENQDNIAHIADLQHRLLRIERPSPQDFRRGLRRAIVRCVDDPPCRTLLRSALHRKPSKQTGGASAPNRRSNPVPADTGRGSGSSGGSAEPGGGSGGSTGGPPSSGGGSTGGSSSGPPATPTASPPPTSSPTPTHPPINITTPGPPVICTPLLGVNC